MTNSNAPKTVRSAREIPVSQRRLLVETYLDSIMNQKKFAEQNGISRRSLNRWLKLYKEGKLSSQDEPASSASLISQQDNSDTVTISEKEYGILLRTYFLYNEGIK